MGSEEAILCLRELPGVGERTLSRIFAHVARRGEHLCGVISATPATLTTEYGLPAAAIRRLCEQRDLHLARCRRIADELRRAGVQMLTPARAPYPARLLGGDHPPPLLFALGNTDIAKRPTVAILASREIAVDSVNALVAIARAAAATRMSVAVGGMKSTHRIAAIATRATGAQRIVVLDRGLCAAFGYDYDREPFGCGDRRAPLDRSRTLALSPFRPEDHAAPNSGRRRDQVIAGLGDVVFACRARPGGETERICLAALRRGRAVVLWDGENRALLESGAVLAHRARLVEQLTRLLAPPTEPPPGLVASPAAAPRDHREGRTPISREG